MQPYQKTALGFKTENLEIERKLKFNKLLPTIEGEYNFLSGSLGNDNAFGLDNYKAGIKVSVPIFIRKERSDLKLSKLKIELSPKLNFLCSAFDKAP